MEVVEGRPGGVVSVLAVDDHRMVREWLRERLPADRFAVVAEASTAAAAVAEAQRHQPDVIVLDLGLPDGWGSAVCEQVRAAAPSAAIVVLTAYGDAQLVVDTIEAGARAYLIKDADDLDIPGVIERVLAGESVLDPRAAGGLLRQLGAGRLAEQRKFSAQEVNILRLAAEGFTNVEIGTRLYLSRHTVKEYLGNAMRKLEVTTRVEAVLEATRRGLIPARESDDGVGGSARWIAHRPAPRHSPQR